jgi:hypothetical protein
LRSGTYTQSPRHQTHVTGDGARDKTQAHSPRKCVNLRLFEGQNYAVPLLEVAQEYGNPIR